MSWGWVRQLPPKRVAIVTAVVAVVALAAYVVIRLRGMDIESPVSLPFAHSGDVLALDRPHLVHLTHEGVVLLGERRVSLDDLAEGIANDARPIIICADQDAPVLHLWYLQATCRPRDVYIAVDDGWRTAVIPANSFGVWYSYEFITVGVYDGEFVVVHDAMPNGIVDDVRDAIDRIRSKWDDARDAYEAYEAGELKFPGPEPLSPSQLICSVYSPSTAPVGVYVKAVDVAYGLGWGHFRTPYLAADAWTRRQLTLPRVGGASAFFLDFDTQSVANRLPPFELPLARNTQPPERGDCVRLWMSDAGDIHWRDKRFTLSEVSSLLHQQAVLLAHQMKRKNQPARYGRFVRLWAQLRVGRHARWERARELFELVHAAQYLHQDLEVRTWLDYGWSDSERMVVGRASDLADVPPPTGLGEQLFRVPDPWQADGADAWFGVHVLGPTEAAAGAYRVAGGEPVAETAARNKQLKQHAKTKLVRLTIDPSVRLWRAVEMIDMLRGLGHTVEIEPYE